MNDLSPVGRSDFTVRVYPGYTSENYPDLPLPQDSRFICVFRSIIGVDSKRLREVVILSKIFIFHWILTDKTIF